jgi:hypothetical protein
MTGKIVSVAGLQRSASTTYTEEVAALIVDRVTNGESLAKIARDPALPSYSTILAWKAAFPEFSARVAMARKARAEVYFDKVLALAEDAPQVDRAEIPGIKLAIETYKWAAERSDPHTFGAKESSGNNGGVTVIIDTGMGNMNVPDDVRVDELGNLVIGVGDETQDFVRGIGGVGSGLSSACEEVRFRELDQVGQAGGAGELDQVGRGGDEGSSEAGFEETEDSES